MIEISHSHAAGTIVDGTSRDTREILRTNGFRWSRLMGAWYLPYSRDRLAKRHVIDQLAAALRSHGLEVSVEIDDTFRPTAEVEADKSERQDARTTALDAKAVRKAERADAAWEAERRASAALPPMGEPIKVGHHSETRHRNALKRAESTFRRAIDADKDADEAARRAQIASRTTEHRYSPVTVKNRIDKLEAEQRADQRLLDGNRRVIARTDEHVYVDQTPAATGDYRARITERMVERADQISYWRGIYTDLQQQGVASSHSRETIKVGDLVNVFGDTWYRVRRVNAKSVSVDLGPRGVGPRTIGYHKIRDHRPRQDASDANGREHI